MLKIKTELADKIKSQLTEKKFQEVMAIIKAQGDDRSFKVIASTSSIDRDNEIIDQSGWELANYLKNPVILWAHDSRALPIGMATKVYLEGGNLVVEGKFAPAEANPVAEQVFQLYKRGYVKTVSVGFIGLAWETARINNKDVWIWKSVELLELSFVPVPANPEALTLLTAKGFDRKLFEGDGKTIEEKVERLEKIAIKLDSKIDKVELKLNERISRKFYEISQRLGQSKADSSVEKKDESEGENDEGRAKTFDDATLAYLSDKKEVLQDLAKFASEALRDIKKIKK